MGTVLIICDQEEERTRLDISVRPRPWEPRVVRAPVPWHQSFLQVRGGGLMVRVVVMLLLQASQFCRHNLFSLNTVMVKLNDLWWRR